LSAHSKANLALQGFGFQQVSLKFAAAAADEERMGDDF
jgi:hypothetical protein